MSDRSIGLRILRFAYRAVRHPLAFLQVVAVLGLAVGAALHQMHFWSWFIEDAAISFAYARNWAWGEGLVAIPGAERLEGYSNPTWVAMLAFWELFGIDSFRSSKWMQVVLAFLTVPLTFLLAREATPRPHDGAAVVAAGFLATSTTFAIWGSSGLENALFSFLLAAALLRSAVEVRKASFPFAAFLWFLLAITRPEAILYAAVAGFLTMVYTLRRGLVPTLQWLAVFFVPFIAYHAVRFNYFAYELPQTYYGKMTTKKPRPLDFNRRGWRYVRNWSHTLWTGYYLPLYVIGLSGSRGWRFGVSSALVSVVGAYLLLPEILPDAPFLVGGFEVDFLLHPKDFPKDWGAHRAKALALLAATLPLVAAQGERGWRVRVLCWSVASSILFFAVYTMGDWMKAWRWMSLLQVPLAVLFGVGVDALVELVERPVAAFERWAPTRLTDKAIWAVLQALAMGAVVVWGEHYAYGQMSFVGILLGMFGAALVLGLARETRNTWTVAGWTIAALCLLVTMLPNMAHLKAQRGNPETNPFNIKKRVDYVMGVKKTLDLQHRIVDLDVDQGGHLWWGRDDFHMHDLAGLVDIPLAQHRFEPAFFDEYIFREVKPDFIHAHGSWASSSRIASYDGWERDYYEIPGFPAGATSIHIGNYIRRDHLFVRGFKGDGARRVELDEGWILEGLRFPSEPATKRKGWLQLDIRSSRVPRGDGLPRPLVYAAKEGVVQKVWSVPLVYDWMATSAWRAHETFTGAYPLSMEGLEPGTYDLGFVLVGPKKNVLLPVEGEPLGPELTRPEAPTYLSGEVLIPGGLTVVDLDDLSRLAREDRVEAIQQAKKGRCEAAERSWDLSRWHRVHDRRYFEQHEPVVRANLSICWAHRAKSQPEHSVDHLARAKRWDHQQPFYLETRAPIAEELHERGMAEFEAGDFEKAYRLLSDAVAVDPTRSWSRRYAEKAREERIAKASAGGRRKPTSKKPTSKKPSSKKPEPAANPKDDG